MEKRKLRGFQLRVFRFEYGAKWKTRSWKTSEFDQSALGKLPSFQLRVFGFGYSAKWKTHSAKPRKTDSPSF